MLKLVFNFFKKINLFVSKNKTGLIFLALVLFLLFTPIHTAKAAWWDDLIKAFNKVVSGVVNLPLNIVILTIVLTALLGSLISTIISSIIYIIIVVIAEWIMNLSMSVAISPSSEFISPVIQTGWNFTSGFVNMFFALTLTFIGLATILRLKEYEAKKLLPNLLLIAILVNFTPVIIGFIVDMGNLVTNFFIEKTTLDIDALIGRIFDSFHPNVIGDYVKGALRDLFGSPINFLVEGVSFLIGLLVPIVHAWAGAYIYACMAAMFFLRIIMLWILTILSPIAFFSYIFPEGSTFKLLFPGILSWKEWWNEFLKWVIVGIPFGLFLYISQEMIGATNLFGPNEVPVDMSIELSGINIDLGELADSIKKILPNIASLMMLYMGYKISMDAAPQMAKSVMNTAGKVAVMAATGGVGAMAGLGARGMGGVASGLEKVGGKLGGVSGKKGGWALKPYAKGLGGLSRLARKGERRLEQRAMKKKPEISKNFKNDTIEQQLDYTDKLSDERSVLQHYNAMDWSKVSKEDKDKRIGRIEGMVGKKSLRDEYGGTIKKMAKAGIVSESIMMGLSDNPEEARMKINDKAGEIKENMEEDKELNEEIEMKIRLKYGVDKSGEGKKQFMKDLAAQTLSFEKFKPGDYKDLGKDGITSLAARLGSHSLSSEGLNNINKHYGDATTDKLFKGIGGIDKTFKGDDGYKELMIKNEKLARYLLTNQKGVALGFNQLNNKEINKEGEEKIDYKNIKDGLEEYKILKAAKRIVEEKDKNEEKKENDEEGDHAEKLIKKKGELKKTKEGRARKFVEKKAKAGLGKARNIGKGVMRGTVKGTIKAGKVGLEQAREYRARKLLEKRKKEAMARIEKMRKDIKTEKEPTLPSTALYSVTSKEIIDDSEKFRKEIWEDTTQSERDIKMEKTKGDEGRAKKTFWPTNFELTSIAKKNKIPIVLLHNKTHYVLVTKLDKEKNTLKTYDPLKGSVEVSLKNIYTGIKKGEQHIIFGGDSDSPEFKDFLDKDFKSFLNEKGNEGLKNSFEDSRSININFEAKDRGDEWLKKAVETVTEGANKFYDENNIKDLEKIKELQKDGWNCGPLSVSAAKAIVKKKKAKD